VGRGEWDPIREGEGVRRVTQRVTDFCEGTFPSQVAAALLLNSRSFIGN